MKNRNVVIYIVIAIVLIALILWYVFSPKEKNVPPAPQPQTSSVTQQPAAPATVAPPAAPATVTTAPQQPAAPIAPPKPTSYTVVRGDCLWRIAAQSGIYANPYEWPLIYKANSDKIKDADLIYPGQVLVINLHPSAAAVAAAIHHARTRGPWSLGKVEASDKAYLAQ